MNFNFSKIKLPTFSVKRILSAEIRGLWNWFLWFLIIFALVVFIFDARVFKHFLGARNEELPQETKSLRTRNFNKALERIEAKKTRLENYRKGFIIEDPS